MKKLFTFLFTLTLQHGLFAQNIPTAPAKIEFASVIVNLDDNAQKAVNNEIYNLLKTNEKFQDAKIERIQLYFPIIEKILQDESVPEDIKYLAVLESSVNPDAVSSTNAVGFWQFKDFTAREMGLTMNENVDERKNIQAATRAAALYIKKNNLIYKNWVSSLLTFSLGVNGSSSYIPVDWSFASEINFDAKTPAYLTRALANKIAYEYKLNRIENPVKKFVEFSTNGKSLSSISSEINIPQDQIKKYNSWLLSDEIPNDKVYNLLILTNMESNMLLDNLNSTATTNSTITNLGFPKLKRITNVTTNLDDPIFYEINGKRGILAHNGMEIPQMAKKSKLCPSKMLRFNDMTTNDVAKEGNVYYLQRKKRRADVKYHTLAPNETLWEVSQKYGVRKKCLLKYNRITNNTQLSPGSVLYLSEKRPRNVPMQIIPQTFEATDKGAENNTAIVPANNTSPETKVVVEEKPVERVQATEKKDETSDGLEINDPLFKPREPKTTNTTTSPASKYTPPTSTATSSNNYYVVQPKETLFSIAKRFGLTVSQLRVLNGMGPNATLQTGQSLKIRKDDYAKVSQKPIDSTEEIVRIPEPPNNSSLYHTVQQGETMYSISKKYKTNVSTIQKLNNLNNYNLEVNQVIIVGKNGIKNSYTTSSTVSSGRKHKINVGETLFSISQKYGTTVNNLKKWNNLTNNNISVGSYLSIKK